MIHYQISCLNPTSQFIQIRLTLDVLDKKPISLQLPAWRAGRYQLANYAQNIRGFRVFYEKKKSVTFKKTSKDRWEIFPAGTGKIQIEYEYWAGKMDAGGAWTDDEQVYVNLVNCCFDVSGRSEEQIEVTLDLPDFPKRVSTLNPTTSSIWKAENFQMLADSTILAAKNLTHWDYQVGETVFHCWFHGEIHFDKIQFLESFKVFSEKLIQDFGEFPEPEYHFIFQLLPYPHYHGVEHRRGTVITFGPATSLQDPAQMEELFGISCHELYHAWNVCRIRPKELLPYNFSKETYTQAGLILEGVTTYMGDLYLLKSGVYDLATYLMHFEKILNREVLSWGWKNNTILESSFDLWLDGYVPGIPDRKVNIYTRGALLAFCIDVILIKNGSSLTRVMRKMWKKFGKPYIGYRLEDFEAIISEEDLELKQIRDFLEDFVYGYQDLFPLLQIFFSEIGIQMEGRFGDDWLLHELGVRTNPEGVISQLHPNCQAFSILMKNDQIVNWPINKSEGDLPMKVQIERYGRLLELSLNLENGKFYPVYHLSPQAPTGLSANWRA